MTDRLSEIRARLEKARAGFETSQPLMSNAEECEVELLDHAQSDLEWACEYIDRLEARLRMALDEIGYPTEEIMAKLKEGR